MITKGIMIFISFIMLLIILSKKINGKGESKIEVNKCESVENEHEEMLEYTRELSCQLGFHKNKSGFKRPEIYKRKGLTLEEELSLEEAKKNNPSFSMAMENLIPLRRLHTEQNLRNKTIRVFIDTQKDTKVIAVDHSAILEIDLNDIFNIAGEFVLINLDKNDDYIKVNYILEDGVVTTGQITKK